MRTLYVRNVPDDVVDRLEQMARRDGVSVNAVVVRQLEGMTRALTNAEVFASLPNLDVSTEAILKAIDEGRAGR